MRNSMASLVVALALGILGMLGSTAPSSAAGTSPAFGAAGRSSIYLAGHAHRFGRRIGTRYVVRRIPRRRAIGSAYSPPGLRAPSIGPAPGLPPPPTYTPPAMQPTPNPYIAPGISDYRASRYRSYDPATNTYQGNDGIRRQVP